MTNLPALYNKIKRLKLYLSQIGIMRPGSISKRYTVCGKKACKCQDKKKPEKHGPYYHLSYTFNGKSYTEFIPQKSIRMIRTHINNYKKHRKLNLELIKCYIELSKLLKEKQKEEL